MPWEHEVAGSNPAAPTTLCRSVQECVPLLEVARCHGLLDDAAHGKLKDDLGEIARMLSGSVCGLDKRST